MLKAKKRRRPVAPWKFYRGYPYLRVSASRLYLARPDGAFLCHVPSARELVREVKRDIRRPAPNCHA